MTELVVATSAAIILSAMCSLFEAVLYSVPQSQIEQMAQAGQRSGRLLKRMRAKVDKPISAILSLNTLANTAGAAVAGAAAARLWGSESLPMFSGAFTLAILIFSEVIPKTAGVVYSRSLAARIAVPLRVLVWLFGPLVWLCRVATQLIPRPEAQATVSEEELLVMAKIGLQAGSIDEDEAAVIHNILGLERKTARQIMTPRTVLFALQAEATVEQARAERGVVAHTRIPIYAQSVDDIVGVVHRREILGAAAEGRLGQTMEQLMRPAQFVINTTPLDRLLRQFLERKQHLFVVLDEYGGTAGIVTLEDVLEEHGGDSF